MINITDILTQYKESLLDQVSPTKELLEKFSQQPDILGALCSLKTSIPMDLAEEFDLTSEQIDAFVTTFNDYMFNIFDHLTVIDEVGNAIKLNAESVTEDIHQVKRTIGETTITILQWTDDLSVTFYGGLTDSIKNIEDIFKNIASSCGVGEIINKAIDLAVLGQLNASNFMASISDYVSSANDQVKTVINVIRDAINSCNALGQCKALFNVLKKVIGITNVTADDATDSISFSSTDYYINTAVFYSFGDVWKTVSSIATSVVTMIKPIIGVIVGAVSGLVSAGIEYVNRNDDCHWKFNNEEERDNDCFAIPVIQYKLPIVSLPQSYQNDINSFGFFKATNAIGTIYGWVENVEDTICYIECFMNATSDIEYYNQSSDGLFKSLSNRVTVTGTPPMSYYQCNSIAQVKINIDYWLNDLTTPGGDAPAYNKAIYDVNTRDNLAARRMLDIFRLYMVIYFAIKYNNSAQTVHSIQDEAWPQTFLDSNLTPTPEEYLCALFAYCNQIYDLNSHNDWVNIYVKYIGSQKAALISEVVNRGFRMLRTAFESLSSSEFAKIFEFFIKGTQDFSDSLSSLGKSVNAMVSHSVYGKANAYVFPPTSSISAWTKLIYTSAVVVGVAIAATITATKIKKHIQYQAFNKRMELKQLKEKAENSGSYSDWSKMYKANKRYNRVYGTLTGTTYDVNNGWLESTTGINGGSDSLSLTPVYLAITGKVKP